MVCCIFIVFLRFYHNQRYFRRDFGVFDFAIDRKLRVCDLVRMKMATMLPVGRSEHGPS